MTRMMNASSSIQQARNLSKKICIMEAVLQQMQINLKGQGNISYEGVLYFRNWGIWRRDENDRLLNPISIINREDKKANYNAGTDPTGATYYVIAVVLVYSMSIVLLIASHIKRKHSKDLEDIEINKYLQEFQVRKETSSRDTYVKLKKDITAKLLRDKEKINKHYRGLTTLSLLQLSSVNLPTINENSFNNQIYLKKKSYLPIHIKRDSVCVKPSENSKPIILLDSSNIDSLSQTVKCIKFDNNSDE